MAGGFRIPLLFTPAIIGIDGNKHMSTSTVFGGIGKWMDTNYWAIGPVSLPELDWHGDWTRGTDEVP